MSLADIGAWASIVGVAWLLVTAGYQLGAGRLRRQVPPIAAARHDIEAGRLEEYRDQLRNRMAQLVNDKLQAAVMLHLAPPITIAPRDGPPFDPPSADIPAVFDDLLRSRPRIVVTGDPGAGKTILALQLAQRWLEANDAGAAPIPVLLRLDAYSGAETMTEWVSREMEREQPRIPRQVGRRMLDGEMLILLLDGFDRIDAEHKAACLRHLADFTSRYGNTAVLLLARSSASNLLPAWGYDYEVRVQPLPESAVAPVLSASDRRLQGLRSLLRDDRVVREELATNPFWLTTLASSFEGWSTQRLRKAFETSEDRRASVIGRYLTSCLADLPEPERVRYLDRLTEVIHGNSRDGRGDIIYPDRVGPKWLPKRVRRAVSSLGLLVLTLIYTAVAFALALPAIAFSTMAADTVAITSLVGAVSVVGAWYVGGGLHPVHAPATIVAWMLERRRSSLLLLTGAIAAIAGGLVAGGTGGMGLVALGFAGVYALGVHDRVPPEVPLRLRTRVLAGLWSWVRHTAVAAAVASPVFVLAGLRSELAAGEGLSSVGILAIVWAALLVSAGIAGAKWPPISDPAVPARSPRQFFSFHASAGGAAALAALWCSYVVALLEAEWGRLGVAAGVGYVLLLGLVVGLFAGLSPRIVTRPLLVLASRGRLTPDTVEDLLEDAARRRIAERHGVGFLLRHDLVREHLAAGRSLSLDAPEPG